MHACTHMLLKQSNTGPVFIIEAVHSIMPHCRDPGGSRLTEPRNFVFDLVEPQIPIILLFDIWGLGLAKCFQQFKADLQISKGEFIQS